MPLSRVPGTPFNPLVGGTDRRGHPCLAWGCAGQANIGYNAVGFILTLALPGAPLAAGGPQAITDPFD